MRSDSAPPVPCPPNPAAPSVVVGSTVGGRYRVLELIGQGGTSQVYEVEHLELGRRFALKLLRPGLACQSEQVERFQLEARAVGRLESTHIVGIVDYGATATGAPFFVMDRLRGSDLRRLITQDGPLPAARTVHIGLDACRGLSVAHQAGIVHRDLKPENLFITRDCRHSACCACCACLPACLLLPEPSRKGSSCPQPFHVRRGSLAARLPLSLASRSASLGRYVGQLRDV